LDFVSEDNITEIAMRRWATARDPRLARIMPALIKHLHAFAKEVELTTEEWIAGIEWITAVGQISDDKRMEAILASDVFGLSMLVVMMNSRIPGPATPPTVLGPFHIDGSPELDKDADLGAGIEGEIRLMYGLGGTQRDRPAGMEGSNRGSVKRKDSRRVSMKRRVERIEDMSHHRSAFGHALSKMGGAPNRADGQTRRLGEVAHWKPGIDQRVCRRAGAGSCTSRATGILAQRAHVVAAGLHPSLDVVAIPVAAVRRSAFTVQIPLPCPTQSCPNLAWIGRKFKNKSGTFWKTFF
jgi:hypothetical protein